MGKVRKRQIGDIVKYTTHDGIFKIVNIDEEGEIEYELKVLEQYDYPESPGFAKKGDIVFGEEEDMVSVLKYNLSNL